MLVQNAPDAHFEPTNFPDLLRVYEASMPAFLKKGLIPWQ